ncbi:hypothetical protein HK102_001915 [Quaeritorhiza haematococci]|nr:hypothetical protein HK102_001915 [Quaeritorhiza haematococci]
MLGRMRGSKSSQNGSSHSVSKSSTTSSISSTNSPVSPSEPTSPTTPTSPGANPIEYTLYHDPYNQQSLDVLSYLETAITPAQLHVTTNLPNAKEIRTLAFLMDENDQTELAHQGVLNQEDIRRIQRGEVDILIKKLTQDIRRTFVRPVLVCPVKGAVVVNGTVEKVKNVVSSNSWGW